MLPPRLTHLYLRNVLYDKNILSKQLVSLAIPGTIQVQAFECRRRDPKTYKVLRSKISKQLQPKAISGPVLLFIQSIQLETNSQARKSL